MSMDNNGIVDDVEYNLDIGSNGCVLTAIISMFFIVSALWVNDIRGLVISVPTLVISIYLLVTDTKPHISIPFIVLQLITLILVQLTSYFKNELPTLDILTDISLGLFLALVGITLIFTLIRGMPGFDRSKPFTVSLIAFCITVSLVTLISMVDYSLECLFNIESEVYNEGYFENTATAIISALVVCVLFYFNRRDGLLSSVTDFFINHADENWKTSEEIKSQILKEIAAGESTTCEFKSTLRTNLRDGKNDPRMERAVLKSIVAFLNGKGGILLVGVADNGDIIGIDVESFDGSTDKFSLHLNNLITKQIGSEYLPFITWSIVDFDGKGVLRVYCTPSKKPVFLKDGKETLFFVRSGPSSIDIHGTDMLYYATHHFGRKLNKLNPIYKTGHSEEKKDQE